MSTQTSNRHSFWGNTNVITDYRWQDGILLSVTTPAPYWLCESALICSFFNRYMGFIALDFFSPTIYEGDDTLNSVPTATSGDQKINPDGSLKYGRMCMKHGPMYFSRQYGEVCLGCIPALTNPCNCGRRVVDCICCDPGQSE